MPLPDLVPVEHNPFVVPVDHDPFDPLAASAGVSPPGTPRVDQINWGQPSWLEQAAVLHGAHNANSLRPSGAEIDFAANMLSPGSTKAAGAAEDVVKGIRAYHGSPHDFDRFDISKIGTGEGAQAYGHGLYFAENEKTAKAYRDALSAGAKPGDNGWIVNGVHSSELPESQQHALAEYIVTRNPNVLRGTPLENAHIDAAPAGKTYEVSINADPSHFLDWDTKVRDMPLAVQEKLKAAGWNTEGPDQGLLGSQIYQRTPAKRYAIEVNPDDRFNRFGPSDAKTYEEAVAQAGGDKNKVREIHDSSPAGAMSALRDAGIPGIKYLDQGSRGSGQGTHNYVVFSDEIISILKKYGLAGLAAIPALYGQNERDGAAP